MSVHPHSAMYLLILCAATIGCGTSAQPDADMAAERRAKELVAQEKAAKEQEAAQEMAAEVKAVVEKMAAKQKAMAAKQKAAADSYVKVGVEIRGVLSCTEDAVTISTTDSELKEHKWVLDFGQEKEMRAKAKELDGKTVSVKGSAILQHRSHEVRGVQSSGSVWEQGRLKAGKTLSFSVLDVEPKIAVKTLEAANKK